MKLVKVFALFVLIHVIGWSVAHVYRSANPTEVLLVVDTSFSMKSNFAKMQNWIEDYEASARYSKIIIGTDKALIGELSDLKSKESIFRTDFGRISADNLKRYEASTANEKILLSDGSLIPVGWTVVSF